MRFYKFLLESLYNKTPNEIIEKLTRKKNYTEEIISDLMLN